MEGYKIRSSFGQISKEVMYYVLRKVSVEFTIWPEPIWIKLKKSWLLLPQHQSTYHRGQEYTSIFQTQIYLVKVPLNVNIVKQDLLNKKQFLKILWCEVWKKEFQLIQILGPLGKYFDAVLVEVKTFLLFFRLALAKLDNP